MKPIRPKAALLGAGAICLAGGVILSLLPFSCSVREPRIVHMPIGQVFTMMPVSVNDDRPVKATGITYTALRLNLMTGGRPVRDGETLRFYKKDVAEPAWTKSWDELSEAYKTTACDNDQIATLDGAEGAALLCDGSLVIEDYHAADIINAEGKVKSATSWATFAVNEDVLAAAIQFY